MTKVTFLLAIVINFNSLYSIALKYAQQFNTPTSGGIRVLFSIPLIVYDRLLGTPLIMLLSLTCDNFIELNLCRLQNDFTSSVAGLAAFICSIRHTYKHRHPLHFSFVYNEWNRSPWCQPYRIYCFGYISDIDRDYGDDLRLRYKCILTLHSWSFKGYMNIVKIQYLKIFGLSKTDFR